MADKHQFVRSHPLAPVLNFRKLWRKMTVYHLESPEICPNVAKTSTNQMWYFGALTTKGLCSPLGLKCGLDRVSHY